MRTYQCQSTGRALGSLACLALLVSFASSGAAQQRTYLIELGAAGAYQSFDKDAELGGTAGGVGRLGVWLPLNLSLEAEGSFASAHTKSTDIGVKVRTFSGSLLYNIPVGSSSTVYLKAGLGSTKYGGGDCPGGRVICGTSGAFLGGAGVRVGVTPTIMIRGEGLWNRNKSDQGSLSNFGANLGLSVMLGSKPIPDSDGDGVLDNRDRCPGSPPGAQVDGRGCTGDDDNDGVPNGVDRCPNTVAGAKVDERGCSGDSDGDNIPDGLDKCPDTPAGVLVDPNGCPRDSDGDGIADGLDRCSATPKGATVDALGCPGDEDGDGVLDGLDRCPRTPSGAAVNALGCASGQGPERAAPTQPTPDTSRARPPSPAPPRQPAAAPGPRPQARATTITPGVLEGVTFEPGTARLQAGAGQTLDSIATILMANPTLRVEIAAHTDNAGSPADNLHLTTLQAEAVRNYLVVKGVAFQQLVAHGYGATVPRTPDTTPRGRAANRRVEIRPLPPGP
jgi:outer membrane protein OmpA-like peptidoglycan-associated protein